MGTGLKSGEVSLREWTSFLFYVLSMLDKNYEIHFAPLQGLTDVSFRRLHAQLFGGVDFYYTPFIRIERGLFRKRDLRDLADDNLENLVPQVLPCSAEELEKLCEPILAKGGKRVDVNIGCPFPPVMAHGRGAALINNPDALADVLAGISKLSSDIEFSLKMRLGYSDASQWEAVIDAINDTPLRHVTMHARIAKQQYRGECDLEAFDRFVAKCKHHVIYNGDLLSVKDVEDAIHRWPSLRGVMIGRGLLADMSLARKLRGDDVADFATAFRQLHDGMFSDAQSRMTEPRQVAEHMKPYWDYFCQDDAFRRDIKAIRKAHTADQYEAAAIPLINKMLNK